MKESEKSKKIENRLLSFFIVAVIYVVAAIGGFFLYKQMNLGYALALLVADVAATIFVFIFSLIFKNASVYDPYWSVQPPVIMAFFAVSSGLNLLGVLLLVAVFYWGIRLTANWAYTFRNLTAQDWRYTMLKEKTKIFYPVINFIGIHMVPTLVVYLCILPAVTAVCEKAEFKPLCLVFIFVSLAAATIQLIADIQMHTFRKNRTTQFIRVGLWKGGRHPNYLGEILMWWGIGLACVTAMPGKWYLIAGAVSNTILFLCVSVPMADGRQSKKPGFAEYKKETRMFI